MTLLKHPPTSPGVVRAEEGKQSRARVQVQGIDCSTPDKNQWWQLKKFSVATSKDGRKWFRVERGVRFDGGPDPWTKIDRIFAKPRPARHVRIIAHSWHKHCAVRFGVILPGVRAVELSKGAAGAGAAETKRHHR